MAEKKNWFDQERSKDEISEPLKEYDISSTPNDFNINTIFDFIESGVVEIPGFQRNYVWDKRRASKLIESLIIGIPVPQIFLFEAAKNQTARGHPALKDGVCFGPRARFFGIQKSSSLSCPEAFGLRN